MEAVDWQQAPGPWSSWQVPSDPNHQNDSSRQLPMHVFKVLQVFDTVDFLHHMS
jgi:hypothetical protein